MRAWRKVLAGLAVVLLAGGVFVGPYFAAYQATRAAIHAAQAEQNTKQTQQLVASILRTDQGVRSLVQYVATAKANQRSSAWFLAEIQAICAAVPGCRPVPVK